MPKFDLNIPMHYNAKTLSKSYPELTITSGNKF